MAETKTCPFQSGSVVTVCRKDCMFYSAGQKYSPCWVARYFIAAALTEEARQ